MIRPMPELLPTLFELPTTTLPLAVTFYDSGIWSTAALVSLLTLTLLEVILGIDNVVFIAILSGKLPPEQRPRAQKLGLALAAVSRIILLCGAALVLSLDKPQYGVDLGGLFGRPAAVAEGAEGAEGVQVAPDATTDAPEPAAGEFTTEEAEATEAHGAEEGEHAPLLVTVKDFIVLLGGLFLVGKAVYEIHDKLEGNDHAHGSAKAAASFGAILGQILLLDVVFSIDSVITAVGIAEYLLIMIIAVLVAVVVMVTFAGPISRFVEKHPTTKILALSFLILIGVVLIAEAFEQEIPKGYIYFSMAFALLVEMINIRMKKVSKPVTLRQSYVDSETSSGYGDAAAAPARAAKPIAAPPAA